MNKDFPLERIKNAQVDIDRGLKQGNYKRLLTGVSDYCDARLSISYDYFPEVIAKLDSIIAIVEDDVVRSLIYAKEAQLFYNFKLREIDRSRVASLEELPTDYREWSMAQCEARIHALIDSAMTPETKLWNTRSDDMMTQKGGFSVYLNNVYSYIANQMAEIDKRKDLVNERYGNIIEHGCVPQKIYFSIKRGDLVGKSFDEVMALYHTWSHSPFSALYLKEAYFRKLSEAQKKELYAAVCEHASRYPGYELSPDVNWLRRQLEEKKLNIGFDGNMVSGQKLTAKVNATNVSEFEVKIYRASYPGQDVMCYPLFATKTVNVEGKVPFECYKELVVADSLPYGDYYIKVEAGEGVNCFGKEQRLMVTDLIPVCVTHRYGKNCHRLFALDITTGAPVGGAVARDVKTNKTYQIPEQGVVLNDFGDKAELRLERGDDRFSSAFNVYQNYNIQISDDINYYASLSTNLGVYRPGEVVKWVAVLYSYEYTPNKNRVVPNQPCTVRLIDANDDDVEEVTVTTDEYGRVAGEFTLPASGLNGTYSIELTSGFEFDEVDEYAYFEVAEFKTPTFEVEYDAPKTQFNVDDEIKFTGRVATFSQVPMRNTEVDLLLYRDTWHWWRQTEKSNFVELFTVTTDDNGRFECVVPSDWVKDTSSFYVYSLDASVTSKGGETQVATTRFMIGRYVDISYNGDDVIEATSQVLLPIEVRSSDDSATECFIRFIRNADKSIVADSIPFKTGETRLDLSGFASGEYSIEAWTDGKKPHVIASNLTLYHIDDAVSPSDDVLWTPFSTVKATSPKQAHLLVASKADNQKAFIIVDDGREVLKNAWITLRRGMNRVEVDLSNAMPTVDVKVEMHALCNSDCESIEVDIEPYNEGEKLNISVESFRDRILSGSEEHWKFKFANANGEPLDGAFMLNVYNKALDKIAPTRFRFTLDYGQDSRSDLVDFNFNMRSRRRMYANSGLIGDDICYSESAPCMSYGRKGGGARIDETVVMRDHEVHSALWLPYLTTQNGAVEVDFSAPNCNSSWIASGVGFTRDMVNANVEREFSTYKPIMVQPELPRFVRNGDVVTLGATVTNACDIEQSCMVKMEIFDIADNTVLKSDSCTMTIAAGEQEVTTVEWNVPNDLATIGFRVIAIGDNCSDGEQRILPVLASVSPLIESQQFYLNPTERTAQFTIPEIPEGAKVSMEYYSNPVWSCVLALPSVVHHSDVVSTSLAHSIYAHLMACGIAKQHPAIERAIERWSASDVDSVLVSSLAKNSSLKIHELAQSPWLGASRRHTLQMHNLKQLFNADYSEEYLDAAIESLMDMQQPDGGFAWVKGVNSSSIYTTIRIVQLFGELNKLGWLPDDDRFVKMIERAIAYLDAQMLIELAEMKNKDYTRFEDYVYTRMYFPMCHTSKETKRLIDRTVDAIAKSWKGRSMYSKAYAALVLNQYGKTKEARNIVRSISQFAITTPSKGVYWDNLQQGGGWFFEKVTLTSLMLQAIHAVEPQSPLIDGVRQWMLVNKGTNDWGTSSLAADAIYALLSTGSNWLDCNSKVEITIDGKRVDFGAVDPNLGYGVVEIDNAHGAVEVIRTGDNPAWGALYWKYSAPMTTVEAAKCDGLSIDKKFVKIDGNMLRNSTSLSVGDKVRVMLTINNSQDLDYVTITDERCSLIEPTDQLSGHEVRDGLWLYRETKDASTNFFIPSLPKGVHVIYYDAVVSAVGDASMGVASVQCQYAPQYVAHSAGFKVNVK